MKLKQNLLGALVVVGFALTLLIGEGAHSQSQHADAVQEAIGQGTPTVVEFGSTKCKACRDMKLVLGELQRTHSGSLAIADVDLFSPAGRGMISRYRIQMMPTQVFYDAHGKETGRHLGPISALEILNQLGLNATSESGARSQ